MSVEPSIMRNQVTISDANIQRQETQIRDIRFDNSKSTESKSAIELKNLLLLFCRLKCYALADNSSIRNISINTNRFLFVSTKTSESFKKVKITHNVNLQTFYYKFIILNQTESVFIVFNSKSKLFAIKKYKRNSIFYIQSVRLKVRSNCIVSIIEVYTIAVEIYIVYKYINVLLQYILAISRDQLVSHKIAAICREIRLFRI